MKSFAFALFLVLTTVGCGAASVCREPAHRNDPSCVVLHNVIDCATAQIQAIVPQFKPVVIALIAKATGQDGTIDWNSVSAALEGLAIADGGCILASIENEFLTKLQAEPMTARRNASFQAGFDAMRAKKWPGVKFKLKAADGKSVLQ